MLNRLNNISDLLVTANNKLASIDNRLLVSNDSIKDVTTGTFDIPAKQLAKLVALFDKLEQNYVETANMNVNTSLMSYSLNSLVETTMSLPITGRVMKVVPLSP